MMNHPRTTKPAVFIFLPLLLLFVSACAPEVPETGFYHESGISFEFPDGWSIPDKEEWRDLQLGEDRTLVTIMDETRSAMFSLVPVQLGTDEAFTLNILDDDAIARAVMFVESIDAAGPGNYGNYELIGKDLADFAGAPLAEIVFEGSRAGKDVKWRRLLAVTTLSDAVIMLIFAAPVDQVEAFEQDFGFIEGTWSWDR